MSARGLADDRTEVAPEVTASSPATSSLVTLRPPSRSAMIRIEYQAADTDDLVVVIDPPQALDLAQKLDPRDPDTAALVRAIAYDHQTNSYDALDHYRAWVDAGRKPPSKPDLPADSPPASLLASSVSAHSSVALQFDAGGHLVLHVASSGESSSLDRAELVGKLADAVGSTVFRHVALHFMAVRNEFQRGELAAAQARVQKAIRIERHFLLETAAFVLDTVASGQPLPPAFDDVFGTSDYFASRFCARPFSEFQIDTKGDVYICCPSYLNLPIGNVRTHSSEELLNSPMALAIRTSILEGSFKYCSRSACPHIRGDTLPKRDDVTAPRLRRHIDQHQPRVNRAHNASLSMDSTCNLWCPSCRTEKIVEKSSTVAWKMQAVDDVVLPLLTRASRLMMNGYGDIFMSQVCQRVLERIDSTTHPHLKLTLLTNGVLFDRRNWSRYPNIWDMIGMIRVSVDAATPETYAVVRRGGDFDRLGENLEFLSELRQAGTVPHFALAFVVQRENFREMPRFVEWAQALGCDAVVFEPLLDWNTFERDGYIERAVHLPQHPLYDEFCQVLASPLLHQPIVVSRAW